MIRWSAGSRFVGPVEGIWGRAVAAISLALFPVDHQRRFSAKLPMLSGSSGGRWGRRERRDCTASSKRVVGPTLAEMEPLESARRSQWIVGVGGELASGDSESRIVPG